MLSYSRSHLADHVLLTTLAAVVTQDRATTAEMLALIAEVERRGLFRPQGYPSMYRYCVDKLGMSEDVACKRILTARAARQFPVITPAIADGRLSVSTVALLSPHLKTSRGEELLTAALGKSRAEVELLIAERFPKPDVPTSLVPVAPLAAPSVGTAALEKRSLPRRFLRCPRKSLRTQNRYPPRGGYRPNLTSRSRSRWCHPLPNAG